MNESFRSVERRHDGVKQHSPCKRPRIVAGSLLKPTQESKRKAPRLVFYLVKVPFPNESRTFGVRSTWLDEVAEHIRVHEIGRDELLFSTEVVLLYRVTPSTPEYGCRLSKRRASISVFECMIFDTRTHRGFLLAARISRA
jgi:hypothetical protein